MITKRPTIHKRKNQTRGIDKIIQNMAIIHKVVTINLCRLYKDRPFNQYRHKIVGKNTLTLISDMAPDGTRVIILFILHMRIGSINPNDSAIAFEFNENPDKNVPKLAYCINYNSLDWRGRY